MSRNKIINSLKKHGVIGTLKLILLGGAYLFGKYVFSIERFIIAERVLNSNIIDIKTKYRVKFTLIDRGNVDLVAPRVDSRKYEIFKNRLTSGYAGFFALDDESAVTAYAWIAFGDYDNPLMGLTINIKENEAYLFDDYTFDEFRGNGIHKFLLTERLKFLRVKKIEKCLVSYRSNNEISRKNYRNNDFTEVKKVLVVQLFGKKFNRIRKL